MHYLINVIVKGENAADALANAETGAEQMVDQEYGADFDWFAMDGRWGQSEAHEVTSLTGIGLLEQGRKSTRGEFDDAMKAVRYMLENFSDDDIYNENFGKYDSNSLPEGVYHLSRWQFKRAGGASNSCYIYAPDGDLWGSRVDNDKDLQHILDNNDNLWVVPIDFHN